MKPLRPFPSAVALVSLLAAALSVSCGSDGPSALDGSLVIGKLEQVIRREGANDTYLRIRTPEMDDYPNCEWWCDLELCLSLEHLAWPILVVEPDGSGRWGGVNDMAIGDTIRARLWGEWIGSCYGAMRIWVIKPESVL